MHHFVRLLALCSIIALTTLAFPALAQNSDQGVYEGDYATVGVGAAVGPSYEGSDDYVFFPVPAIQARIGGIEIQPRAAGLALNILPEAADSKVSFQFGPAARLRFNRNRQIEDDVVKLLGKRDMAVEVGPSAGVTVNQLLHEYDSLTASVDVLWDVAGAHDGMTIQPGITYFTPLSRGMAVAASVNAAHVDDDFADYYFSISGDEAVASGLAAYSATGGWKSLGAGLLGTVDLDGDLLNGGFSIIAAGNYNRLLGEFKDSPIVADRGSADQWVGIVGIAYTF